MIAEAADFADECEATYKLLQALNDADYGRETQFKGWLINDIIQHLYTGDIRAHMTLTDPEAFARVKAERQSMVAATTAEKLANQRKAAGYLEGRELLEAWRASAAKTAAAYAEADPKRRVAWVGPDMSTRSSITARLMETWAHSQALYDILGAERLDGDRIRAIAHLGAITYGWTFANRGEEPPGPPPLIRLTAPSGAIWEWNAGTAAAGEIVEGPAVDFCQVVAQTRNIADVTLSVTGKCATAWMNQAQCFAGPPNDPPAPGSRFKLAG